MKAKLHDFYSLSCSAFRQSRSPLSTVMSFSSHPNSQKFLSSMGARKLEVFSLGLRDLVQDTASGITQYTGDGD